MEIDVIQHSEWADTKFTLHLISQILGKIKLETAQQEPQWQHVTLALTPNGFTTGLLFHEGKAFQLDLDIYESCIRLNVEGHVHKVALETSKSIKDYFGEIFGGLRAKGVSLTVNPKPQEMAYRNRLDEDETPLVFNWEHALKGLKMFQFAYREQLKFAGPLRCRKMKPALFWGTFDVSTLLLPGIPAPFPEDKVIEKAAFDEHMIELGFWLGDERMGGPAFFILPYPFLFQKLDNTRLKPAAAYWDPQASEYFLTLESLSGKEHGAVQEFFGSAFSILSDELGWQETDRYFAPLDMPKQNPGP